MAKYPNVLSRLIAHYLMAYQVRIVLYNIETFEGRHSYIIYIIPLCDINPERDTLSCAHANTTVNFLNGFKF